jgi:hypothetical protein
LGNTRKYTISRLISVEKDFGWRSASAAAMIPSFLIRLSR